MALIKIYDKVLWTNLLGTYVGDMYVQYQRTNNQQNCFNPGQTITSVFCSHVFYVPNKNTPIRKQRGSEKCSEHDMNWADEFLMIQQHSATKLQRHSICADWITPLPTISEIFFVHEEKEEEELNIWYMTWICHRLILTFSFVFSVQSPSQLPVIKTLEVWYLSVEQIRGQSKWKENWVCGGR